MTDDRSRRFEQDLSAVLRRAAGDGAPASLRYRLADVTASPPLERRWLFAPPLRWAAAAVAVIALAVLAFLMLPHENVGPTPTSSAQPTASGAPPSGSATPTSEASPTATPSVSPSPTLVPTPAPAGWSSLTWSKGVALADGQFLSDIVPWGDGYVGVGGIDDASGSDPAFFTSRDGTHWTLVKRQSWTKTDDLAGMLAAHVVRTGNRLLAVGGAVTNGPVGPPTGAAPLWMSVDGTHWTSVDSPTWSAASTWPAWLLSGPGGVVAVRSGTQPLVLFSRDGSTWTPGTLPAAEQAILMDAVAWSGGFVIVGRDGQPDSACCAVENTPPPPGVGRPAAWISSDGLHWSEAAVEGDKVAGAALRQVMAVHAGLLALGTAATADAYDGKLTSWTSSDGRTWSADPDLKLPDGIGPYPVYAADGEEALVVGFHPDSTGLPVWATTGADSWARLAATGAPLADCAGTSNCLRPMKAWPVSGGFIVVATPGSMTPQTLWFVAGS